MQQDRISIHSRPHKETYKVCRELAATICEYASSDIKAFAFYIAIKHHSQSSMLNNWRKNIPGLKKITGINSENTIRKRIKECYQLGFLHGNFKDDHLKCKKNERLLKAYKIPLRKESITSISKIKINGTKKIESFIKICAFDKHRERQIHQEKKALVLKELGSKLSNKEKLSKGLNLIVKEKIKSVDDKAVLMRIRTGRRKLGDYIQRSGVTATRVIRKAKELSLVRDVRYRPQLVGSFPAHFEIDDLQLWAMKKFQTYAFYKDGDIWLKYANSVFLNLKNEFQPVPKDNLISNILNNTLVKERRGQSVCFTF